MPAAYAYPPASPPAGSPAAGTFTATWNGSSLVNSVTSTGQVVAVHAGVVLASLACPPPGVRGQVYAAAGNPPGAAVLEWAGVPC